MADFEEYNKSFSADKEDNLSLAEIISQIRVYWDVLWAKKWIIIICGVAFGILGLTYSIVRKINYTATYVFSIEGGTPGMSGGISSISSLLGMGGSQGAFSGDNIVELLKSQRLVEKALLSPIEIEKGRKETFMEYFIAVNELREGCDEIKAKAKEQEENVVTLCDIYFPLGQARESFTREQDSVLISLSAALLKKNLSVAKRDKKLAFVDFSITSSNELFSKSFARALLNEVSSFYIDTKTSISRKNIEIFQLQADSVRKELNNALSSRAYYADENVNAAKQVVGVQLQRKQMDIQIYGTAYAEMIKNIEMLKLDLARETPLIQVIDAPVLPLDNDKMGKKKGLVIGGFLGGFLSCAVVIALKYIQDLRQKIAEIDEKDEEDEEIE